jgi:hypothetical protein
VNITREGYDLADVPNWNLKFADGATGAR